MYLLQSKISYTRHIFNNILPSLFARYTYYIFIFDTNFILYFELVFLRPSALFIIYSAYISCRNTWRRPQKLEILPVMQMSKSAIICRGWRKDGPQSEPDFLRLPPAVSFKRVDNLAKILGRLQDYLCEKLAGRPGAAYTYYKVVLVQQFLRIPTLEC